MVVQLWAPPVWVVHGPVTLGKPGCWLVMDNVSPTQICWIWTCTLASSTGIRVHAAQKGPGWDNSKVPCLPDSPWFGPAHCPPPFMGVGFKSWCGSGNCSYIGMAMYGFTFSVFFFFLDTSLIRNVCAIVSINNSLDTNLIHKAIPPPKNSWQVKTRKVFPTESVSW